MTQEQYIAKQRKFQHLTREKRAQIEILLRQGLPKVQIARAVGISRSTLYNELNRGTVEQIDTNLKKYQQYFWDAGQRAYEQNRKNSRPPTHRPGGLIRSGLRPSLSPTGCFLELFFQSLCLTSLTDYSTFIIL